MFLCQDPDVSTEVIEWTNSHKEIASSMVDLKWMLLAAIFKHQQENPPIKQEKRCQGGL